MGGPQPSGRRLEGGWLLDFSTSKINERSGNVYENKG
jgi:hypothetical protein